MPNITGSFSVGSNSKYRAHFNSVSGAFYTSGSGETRDIDGGSSTAATLMNINASRNSSIYGASDTVVPSHVKTLWCIKH